MLTPPPPGAQDLLASSTSGARSTRSWWSSEDGTRLLGGILVGDAEDYGTLLQMMQNGLPLPANPEQLICSRRGEAATSRRR